MKDAVLDEGLRKIIEIAEREGIILVQDRITDVKIVRLNEHGDVESMVLTFNPEPVR